MTSQYREIRPPSRNIVQFMKFVALFFGIVRARLIWHMLQILFMIETPRPHLLTLLKAFFDLSVSFNLLTNDGIRQFGISGNLSYETIRKRRVKYVLGSSRNLDH